MNKLRQKWRAIMNKHQDRRSSEKREPPMMNKHRGQSGEEWEPLDEHATFRLGIDYAWRWAFVKGQPMSRDEFEVYKGTASISFGYGGPPPYDEYLRLYDMYSETCRLRAKGVSACDAAEAVRGRIDPDALNNQVRLHEASFAKLGVNRGLRGAFTLGRPLSREEYERTYVFGNQTGLPEWVQPYEDYVRGSYDGEMGGGRPSREQYMARYRFVAPSYKEYLQLYKKYSEELEKQRRKG